MKERIPEELRRLGRKEEENLLAFAAERSVSMMQAYCNREDLPKELWSVGVALAQQLLDAADVKSIKEGGRKRNLCGEQSGNGIVSRFSDGAGQISQSRLVRNEKRGWFA